MLFIEAIIIGFVLFIIINIEYIFKIDTDLYKNKNKYFLTLSGLVFSVVIGFLISSMFSDPKVQQVVLFSISFLGGFISDAIFNR